MWQVVGPVCLDLKKLQDTGLVGNLEAATETRQRGRMVGRSLRNMVPIAGARLAATALPCDLGDIASLPVPQFLFGVNQQWWKLSRAPVVTSAVSEAAIYLFISVCTIRLHLYVYPGVL